jgi:hypothetical protein
MKIIDLEPFLFKLNIPESQFSINNVEFPNEEYCIFFRKPFWEVYYSEKGNKNNLKKFKSEEEACEYFVSLVLL